MTPLTGTLFAVLCLLLRGRCATGDEEVDEENRPYEFSFNIVDFQHRYEKKDKDGLVTGEYGFITADGVYHETGYATDKSGDFIITRMKNRRITALKDAQEIFKDRPEAAKKLVEAIKTACSGCRIPAKQSKPSEPTRTNLASSALRKQVGPIPKTMATILSNSLKHGNSAKENKLTAEDDKLRKGSKGPSIDARGQIPTKQVLKDMVEGAKEILKKDHRGVATDAIVDDGVLERMANDLYYRFNYTITSHGHHEDGYRGGKKDGGYRAQSENGVDTQVRYLSNEFGHQPNVTFVPRANATKEEQALKGYSFLWYWP